MALPKVNFEINVSEELIAAREAVNDLERMRDINQVTPNNDRTLFSYPSTSPFLPMTRDEYFDLLDRFSEEYSTQALADAQQEVVRLKQLSQGAYDTLKQKLQVELQKNNPASPILEFDDNALRVEIGCGFKEFVNRFDAVLADVRRVIAPDQNDRRPYQDIFRDDLARPEIQQACGEAFETAMSECRAQGDQAFKELEFPVALDQPTDGDQAITTAFQDPNQPGICLDDIHNTAGPPEFLTDNMDALANSGVNTLFIEHLWQEYQTALDHYFENPNADLDPSLVTALDKLDRPFKDTNQPNNSKTCYKDLVIQAKASGVRLVGLDSFESKPRQDGDPRVPDRRAATFNVEAAKVIAREQDKAQKKGGQIKFVLFAGSAHNNTHEDGFPGLAQMLGVPAMKVEPGGKLAPSKEENPRGVRSEAEQAYYDAFIETVFQAQKGQFPPNDKQADFRRENLRKAANEMARGLGKKLDALDPAGIAKLGMEAGRRLADKMTNDPTFSIGGNAGHAHLIEATEGPDTYKQALKQIDDAWLNKDFAAIVQILKTNPDERLLLGPTKLPDGQTFLHLACTGLGSKELAEELLGRGAQTDIQDPSGNTPLHLAFSNITGRSYGEPLFGASEALLNAGARIDLKNSGGLSPVQELLSGLYTNSESPALVKSVGLARQLRDQCKQRDEYAQASQPDVTKPLQVFAAVFDGNTDLVKSLNNGGELLSKTIADETLVHVAARGGHLDTVKALVNKGADIKAKTPQGRNALHRACAFGSPDNPELGKYLVRSLGAEGAEIAGDGKTALMLAVENGQSGLAGAMIKSPHLKLYNRPDKTGATPFLMSISRSDKGDGQCEQAFYEADPTLDTQGPVQPVSTVEMLKWMTLTENEGEVSEELLEELYQGLYDDPFLRPVLEIAARDGVGSRVDDPNRFGKKALRIIAANDHGSLGGGGGQGNYMPYGNRLNIGSKQSHGESTGKGFWLDSVKGSLIHELTHHAAAVTYDNDTIPLPRGNNGQGNDTDVDKSYVEAFTKDVLNYSHLALTDEEHRAVLLVSGRLDSYVKPLSLPDRTLTGGENMRVELIVGVSQAIAELGLPLVKKLYPNFTQYYQDTFVQDINDKCQSNEMNAPNLDPNLDVSDRGTLDAPSKMFIPNDDTAAETIWKKIEGDFIFKNGTPTDAFQTLSQDGVPITRPENLELDQKDRKSLDEAKLIILPLLKKQLGDSDTPPHLPTDRIRKLVRAVAKECAKGSNPNDLKLAVAEKTARFVNEATGDFGDEYLSSARQRLNRKVSKEYALKPREIAELIVVRASDSVSQGQAVSVNPKKLAQVLDFMEKQIQKKMGEGQEYTENYQELIRTSVAVLVKDKDFLVKKENKGDRHVSMNVGGAQKVWKKKLKEIKV